MFTKFNTFLLATLASSSIALTVASDATAETVTDDKTITLSKEERAENRSASRDSRRASRLESRAERRALRRGRLPGDNEIEPQPQPQPQPEPEPEIVVKSPSQGIFHSAGAITSNGRGGNIIREGINDQAHVSGSLVRVEWAAINSAEGVYDFSAIENELAKAASLNSDISLAILDSLTLPDYVLAQCETFDYQFRGVDKVTCLPWDEAYQMHKASLLNALGAQFDSHPNLTGVYFSYSAMTNGIEMHWRVDEAAFTRAGYTEARLLDSYNTIMDMYNAAFPTTSIIMEVHEVFKSSALAENAFDYCHDTMGERCGVAIWWCSSRMATNPRESEYDVYHVAQQATELSFAVCQTIGSFTDSPDRFDSGQGWTTEEAFINEMSFFIGEGFRNFEIWSNDITNEALVEIIEEHVVPGLN